MHNYFFPFISVLLRPYPDLVFIMLLPGQSHPYMVSVVWLPRYWACKNLLPQYSSSGICKICRFLI